MMLKKELRLNFTKLREQFTAEEVFSSSNSISKHVFNLPLWELEYYHVFLPIEEKKEVDTQLIIEHLKKINKKIVVPKVKDGSHLEHILLEEETVLKKNPWGIPEPQLGRAIPSKQIDLVFIPLLAFDKKGHRVGYGKGYYDRFLKTCREDVLKIGLCFFEPVEEITDITADDMVLDCCVTPKKIYSF